MKFGMQVLIRGRWEDVHPTGEAPYRFETEEEADRSLRMCYPGVRERGEARVSIHEEEPPC